MQILWLAHRDPLHPRAGGAERTTYEVGRRLVARGHSFTVIACRFPGGSGRGRLDGVEIERYADPIAQHALVPNILRRHPNAEFVVDDLAHVVPWASERWTTIPGAVYFRHLHLRTLPGQVGKVPGLILAWLERRYPQIYRRWPFVVESESAAEDLGTLGIGPERCIRIPPGVDRGVFRPRPLTELPQIVFFAGLRPYKRPDHAILALAELRRLGFSCRLVIAGTGPTYPELVRLVANLALDSYVEFLGRADDAGLAERVGESWVSLVCSVSEGWGLTALEAAAAGVPTVGYSVPGISESVQDGRSGLLVSEEDPRALARAVMRVCSDRVGWTAPCLAWAEDHSWERTVEAWEQSIRRLTETPAR